MVISSSVNDEMTPEFTVAPDSVQEWKLDSGRTPPEPLGASAIHSALDADPEGGERLLPAAMSSIANPTEMPGREGTPGGPSGAVGPGVHGLVRVHVLDVALRHLPQRLGTVRATLADRRDRGRLPGRPGLAVDAALLDDAEQPARARSMPQRARPS